MRSITILIFTFLSIICLSQTNSDFRRLETNQLDAGYELIKAQKHHFASLGFSAAGSAIALIGMSDNSKPLIYLGGASMITGFVFSITSWIHIGNAGKSLYKEDDALTVGLSPGGIMASYTF